MPENGSDRTAPTYALAFEQIADCWNDLDRLARMEHAEMEVGFRPYGPDWEGLAIAQAGGTFKCLTARKRGELIGYLTWFIDFDLEAKGTLIVHQAAWYVIPGHWSAAARMFYRMIDECRRLNVKIVYLHNAERGRGQTLGRFFEKNGAVHVSNTYALRLPWSGGHLAHYDK